MARLFTYLSKFSQIIFHIFLFVLGMFLLIWIIAVQLLLPLLCYYSYHYMITDITITDIIIIVSINKILYCAGSSPPCWWPFFLPPPPPLRFISTFHYADRSFIKFRDIVLSSFQEVWISWILLKFQAIRFPKWLSISFYWLLRISTPRKDYTKPRGFWSYMILIKVWRYGERKE